MKWGVKMESWDLWWCFCWFLTTLWRGLLIKPASSWFHSHIIPATQSWSETQLRLQNHQSAGCPCWSYQTVAKDTMFLINQPTMRFQSNSNTLTFLHHEGDCDTHLSSLDCFLSSHTDETTKELVSVSDILASMLLSSICVSKLIQISEVNKVTWDTNSISSEMQVAGILFCGQEAPWAGPCDKDPSADWYRSARTSRSQMVPGAFVVSTASSLYVLFMLQCATKSPIRSQTGPILIDCLQSGSNYNKEVGGRLAG